MAKRIDEDETIEAPVERKRRRARPKPVEDDDEGGRPSARKGEDDGGDEENSISTGNVLLDIILDFRDDCFYWAQDHFVLALGLGITALLIGLVLFGLTIRYIVNYINRPTLRTAITAYDLGAYGEAKRYAEIVLKYTPENDLQSRSMLQFILGASTCSIAEISWASNRQPFYLSAANYLGEANRLGFPPDRRTEGYFLFGKSLYLSGEIVACREPLLRAFELEASNTKMILWYLANSYFLAPDPEPLEALRYIRLFQRNPLTTENENYEADLLRAMILLQLDRDDQNRKISEDQKIAAAEKAFLKVPLFERFETMRNFVSGQIAFSKARMLRQKALDLENNRDPENEHLIQDIPGPIAPSPVKPEAFPTPFDSGEGENLLPAFPNNLLPNITPPQYPDTDSLPGPSLNSPTGFPIDLDETSEILPSDPDEKISAFPVGPILGAPTQIREQRSAPNAPQLNTPFDAPLGSQTDTPIDSAAGSPWAIIAPVPIVDDNTISEEPLFRRMTLLAERNRVPNSAATAHIAPRFADNTPINAETNTATTPATDPNPNSVTPSSSTDATKPRAPLDPNAIIVLPNRDKQRQTQRMAPSPQELPDVLESSFIDPRLERAKALHRQAEERYEESIRLFLQVQERDTFVPRWLRTAQLLEGICREELKQFEQAQKVYLDLSESFPGTSEAVAAHFFWAVIERVLGRAETALAGFARAFDSLRNLPNYACPWLSKNRILQESEAAVDDLLDMKDYPKALTLLHLLREIMPGVDIARYRSEIFQHWAEDLRKQAETTFGEEGDVLLREMYDKYCRAGEAFEEFARYRFTENDYDQRLWQAAENFRLGRDFRRSIPLYRKFLQVNWKDNQPEALYYMGEMFIQLDALDQAVEYLERILQEFPNHQLTPRTRLALSRAYYEQKEWDKAKQLLQRNLVDQYAPSSTIYRDSIYALARLSFERGELSEAIPLLEDAIKIHPDAIQAADAHYNLSRAFLKQADNALAEQNDSMLEDARRQIQAEIRSARQKALYHMQKAEEALVKRQNAVGLTESEQLMLRNCLFGAGNIMLQLGRYSEAIPVFNIAATRYLDRPESLDALLQLALAYRGLGRDRESLPILNRAEVVLNHFEENGTIPKDNRWGRQIRVQKNLLLSREQSTDIPEGNRP